MPRGLGNDRRAAGKSWRLIALDLRDETDIDLTYETLRGWYTEDAAAAPTSGSAA